MDQQRFNAALRALHTGTTRRRGLAAALGVILGGAGLDAAAKGRRHPAPEGPCGDGSAKDNRCASNTACCTKYCANGACRCKPNWMECTKSAHCCSGRCSGGKCDGSAKPEGSACAVNFNCQDGLACINGVCTESSKAKCTRSNCSGCCEGTICRVGSTVQGCGAGGAACVRCAAGATCANGVCETPPSACGPANCPNGCCDNGQCVTGTEAAACGATGGACAVCSGGTPLCCAGACAAGTLGYVAQMGTGAQGLGSDQFDKPRRVTLAASGTTAYVVDSSNSRLMIWTKSGETWSSSEQIGSYGSGQNQFSFPEDVVVNASETAMFVTDSLNNRVSIWEKSGATWAYSTQLGSGTAGTGSDLHGPIGVALSDDEQTVYITDSYNCRVAIYEKSGGSWTYSSEFGSLGAGNEQFQYPQGITLGSDQATLYIVDGSNQRISIWKRTGSVWAFDSQVSGSQGSGANQFDGPKDVSVSADGTTLAVADAMNNRISVWTKSGGVWSPSVQFGTQGSNPNQLNVPYGVTYSADALTYYIADTYNYRISIWASSCPP